MKKLRTSIAIVAMLTMFGGIITTATPASSHGSCSAPAWQPRRVGSSMTFQGMLDCSSVHTIGVTLTIYGDRRTPGGSWTQATSYFSGNRAPTADIGPVTISTAFDCHKDYRTRTSGVAQNSPGGAGHQPSQTSAILLHTC